MSAAGVFKLICNDGKADALLLATTLLLQRIREIMCTRRNAGMDPTPTLLDIEKTHVLFMNAHFKPFAALGFEYNKVKASSGTSTLGGQIQFSIPQFGDFFHDMVVRTVLTPCYTALGTATQGTANAGGAPVTNIQGVKSTYPCTNEDWDGVTELAVTTYSVVDPFGNAIADGTPFRNMIRYVDFPGERLFNKVQFEVNGNPLDEYTHHVPTMLRKFMTTGDQLTGYKRLVGQELPRPGYGGPRLSSVEDTHYNTALPATAAAHGGTGPALGSLLNVSQTPAAYMTKSTGGNLPPNTYTPAAPINQTTAPVQLVADLTQHGPHGSTFGNVSRSMNHIVDGPQTPKYWQPELEIWNRLNFWFNTDARLSVPSVAIPFGQRFITITLAQGIEMVSDFPGAYIKQTTTYNGGPVVSYRPYQPNNQITYPEIKSIDLYINNIFVNPEIHDLYIARIGFSLIRVFRQQNTTKNQTGDQSELLSQLKWPIEAIFVGFQPTHNMSHATNHRYATDWHKHSKTVVGTDDIRTMGYTAVSAVTEVPASAADADAAAIAATSLTSTSNVGQIVPNTYTIDLPVVETLSMTAHGVRIFDVTPASFFNTYQPFHFGGSGIRTPDDIGVLMINFGLFTGCYQPNGYLNVSRARELYLGWTGDYITATTPVMMIAVAIAINFLLITDGSAVLRYST